MYSHLNPSPGMIIGILMLALAPLFSQNIITVSSSSGFAADHTSLHEAINAAVAGDIILVHGGSYEGDFGTITLNKSLQIYGTGYFLTENPGTQQNPIPATIRATFNVEAGAEGSIISGLDFNSYIPNIKITNITFRRCRAPYINLNDANADNILIEQCYFYSGGVTGNSDVTGIVVRNCYINQTIYRVEGIFENNIIKGIYSANCSSLSSNSIFRNNIFIGTTSDPVPDCSANGNVYYNNLFVRDYSAPLNFVGGGNQVNLALDALFVGPQNNSTDGQWELKAGSPGIGAGEGGSDCGIFGGANPYVRSGIPAGPTIYELTVDPIGTAVDGLNVQIKARIQN